MASLNSPTGGGDDRERDPSGDPEPGSDYEVLDLSAELPGPGSFGPEIVQIEVQLPNQVRTTVVSSRLWPVIGFAVVSTSAAILGVAVAFVSCRVDAPSAVTEFVAAGTGLGTLCIGLIWLAKNKGK